MTNDEIVRRLWELFEARDWDTAAELLHDDFVSEWPHTGEVIRGRWNYIELNRNYPEGWSIEIRRIVAEGDLVASELRIPHPEGVTHAAALFELRGGKIASATEYFVEGRSQEPPAWRARWVETPD